MRALFYGLGADGTVGANKNSVKILAADPARYAQGYFVYDSKKSGSYTISHLRFGPKRVRAPYLLKSASFVGVHKFDFLFKQDVLGAAAPGATVLINSPYGPDTVWDELPRKVQQQIIDRKLKVFVVDASQGRVRSRASARAAIRSCRPASSRFRACCRATRRSPRSRRRPKRPTRARAPRS